MSLSQAVSTSPAARIFLSYKRNVEPDQTLAHELVAGLSEAGHAVFIDKRLSVGQTWAQEIEAQVRGCQFLIVLVTAESSRSEMVRGEIELARHHAATHSTPHILPVRIDFDGVVSRASGEPDATSFTLLGRSKSAVHRDVGVDELDRHTVSSRW